MSAKRPGMGKSPDSEPSPDDIPTQPAMRRPPELELPTAQSEEPTYDSTVTIASGRHVFEEHPRGNLSPPGKKVSLAKGSPKAKPRPMKSEKPYLIEGSTFWDYTIKGTLGRGGMGTVYKAHHQPLDRMVALKVLDKSQGDIHDENVRRFMREARNTAALRHPNIVTIYDFGRVDGQHFIEMEYIRGVPLTTLIRKGPIPPEQASRYIRDTAKALGHAHAKGIYHRDIKPSNILLEDDGSIKVVDFGLSLAGEGRGDITKTGDLLGTFHYMAPELWQSLGSDARTDLYALGITYYQLLTGQLPFRGGIVGIMQAHVSQLVPDPREINKGTTEEMHQIVQILTAKDPTLRFPTAIAVAAALDSTLL